MAPRWSRGVFFFTPIALLVLHAALLLTARSWFLTPALSDFLQFLCSLLAAICCLYASRRLQGFGKQFWLLISTGFFIWSSAQLFVTYYEDIVRAPLHMPWPSDIVFFVSMAPAFLALFIDTEHGFQWKDWPRVFDVIQVVILGAACYLFAFQTIEDWRNGWGRIGRLAWLPDSSRDAILLIGYISAAFLAKGKLGRDLYRRMAIFFFLYLSGEIPFLYLQSTINLRTGSLWDLVWSLPFVSITLLAAASGPIEEEQKKRRPLWNGRKSLSQWSVVHVVTLAFPLVILLMVAGIAEKQLLLATVLVVVSFACSIARIIVGEQQQRHAAAALEERNALLRSVFEGTSDAIYVKDADGRYLMVNDRVAAFFGKTRDEIIGKTVEQLTDAATARLLTKDDGSILESGKSVTAEFQPPGDEKRSFLITRSPHVDASGKVSGIIGISRDITEHRLMEERLRQSQKMEAIGTLAGGVAHDFNNILMVISGYGSVLHEALSDPKLRAHVEQIQKAGERAASLTRQLLAFSRKQAIQPVPLNLNSVVTGMEKLLHRLIGEHITISAKLDPQLGTVLADAGQIEQVILNLAINARDAMPDGGCLTLQTGNVQIHESPGAAPNVKPGSYAELVIGDTGIGMDLAVQARIFEPFFTTKALGKGTGLGLSTVYGIVEQANGHITFTSQPGGGTTFRVYLPRIDSALPAGDFARVAPQSLEGHETVLLVEDDPAVCEFVRAVLISHGYDVLSARRPQEAETLCDKDGSIDLLLSDVVMPEMNGRELSLRLQKKHPQMKVLFMSGYIDEAVVHEGIRENKVAFLQKPFSPLSLARKVREVLDGQPVR